MAKALKYLLEENIYPSIPEAERPKNVYAIWAELFPSLLVLRDGGMASETALKKRASDYSGKEPSWLVGKLVGQGPAGPSGHVIEVSAAIACFVGLGGEDEGTLVARELTIQLGSAVPLSSDASRGEFVERLAAARPGFGFVFDDEFRDELLKRMREDFPHAEGMWWREFEYDVGAVERTLWGGGFYDGEPGEAEELVRALLAILLLGCLLGPRSYSSDLGVTLADDTPIAWAGTNDQPGSGPARAQLVPIEFGRRVVGARTAGKAPTQFCSTDEVRIGRNPVWASAEGAVAVVTGFPSASRAHATICFEGNDWVLSDVGNDGGGSSNGTLVIRASGDREFLCGGLTMLNDGDCVCLAPSYLEGDVFVAPIGSADACYRFEELG